MNNYFGIIHQDLKRIYQSTAHPAENFIRKETLLYSLTSLIDISLCGRDVFDQIHQPSGSIQNLYEINLVNNRTSLVNKHYPLNQKLDWSFVLLDLQLTPLILNGFLS